MFACMHLHPHLHARVHALLHRDTDVRPIRKTASKKNKYLEII